VVKENMRRRVLAISIAVVAVGGISASFLMRPRARVPLTQTSAGQVSAGATLSSILQEAAVEPAEARAIIAALRAQFDPRRCGIGDRWEVEKNAQGETVSFTYHAGPLRYYRVFRDASGFAAQTCEVPADRRLFVAKGAVSSSLYESMLAVGVSPELIMQFAEVFASKVDFFTDCRKDDEYCVLWESFVSGKTVLKDIRVLAARYARGDAVYQAFYFSGSSATGYYDEKGRSVEHVFNRAPLNYRRISSFFSHRRFHPILRVYRPHLGIDYVAPTGTPVSAIGAGRVLSAGWTGNGYGIAVKIGHPNGYISYYGHLSRVARGVRAGAHVAKGQVIGYVGSTGLATGPHLDFRLKRNGTFINFLALNMPASEPLPQEQMDVFNSLRAEYAAQMAQAKESSVVALPPPKNR